MDGRAAARERRRAHVQARALELFDDQGYANVTVEAVAEAAGVSVQSVYNYFATKPGIVLHGAHDDAILSHGVALVRDGHPIAQALRDALRANPTPAGKAGVLRSRTRLMLHEPEVRAAYLSGVDATADALAQAAISRPGDPTPPERAYPEAMAAVGRTVGALKAWMLDGGHGDPAVAMVQALDDGVGTRPPDPSQVPHRESRNPAGAGP